MTSSRRQSRRSSRNCRTGSRRRLVTSSKPRHVTETSAVTSSGAQRGPHDVTSSDNLQESRGVTLPGISQQESPAVTSSSINLQGPCPVTSSRNLQGPRDALSSGTSQEPRGRTSCKYSHRYQHRTESPTVTSSGKSQELPRGFREPYTSSPHSEEFPSQPASSRKTDTFKKPDHHGSCVRSTSVPPPSTMPPNPFSPFWNFLFKGPRRSSWREDDDDEDDHVCNTVRSPRRTWFASSAIITNIYLSTVNRWTGVWPTAAGYLATSGRKQKIDDGSEEENELLTSSVASQFYHAQNTADAPQVGNSIALLARDAFT